MDQSVVSQNFEIICEEEPVSQENNLQKSEESEDVAQSAAKLLYMGQTNFPYQTPPCYRDRLSTNHAF